MDTDRLANPTVKAGDRGPAARCDAGSWAALFEHDARCTTTAARAAPAAFTRDALGHERFTRLTLVANHGLDVTGHFHLSSGRLSRVYFRFQPVARRKDPRLDRPA
jgi:hypothetical protein